MNINNSHILLIWASILALTCAYFIEYVTQVPACPLCIYQRFPYLMIIFIAIIAIAGKGYKFCRPYLIIAMIGAIALAGYHSGIERGVFELSSFCKPLISIKENISVHDFQRLLENKNVALCSKPALVILYLSLTEWNLLLNVILLFFYVTSRRPEIGTLKEKK